MSRRTMVTPVVALAALLLMPRAGRADTLLAQGTWPPPLTPPMQPVAGPRVMLQADKPNARLQQYSALRWRDVCLAPCGKQLDPKELYRIGGGTAIASEPFQLPRASGDVFIDAQVGSKVGHWVGLGLMIGGAVSAIYGVLYWQVFNSIASGDTSQPANDARSFGRTVGITLIGVGAVLEVIGIVLFSGGTSVQVR